MSSITVDDREYLVHGIVATDPWTVRCDGCPFEATSEILVLAAKQVLFDPLEYSRGDKRRLCASCREEAGWRA